MDIRLLLFSLLLVAPLANGQCIDRLVDVKGEAWRDGDSGPITSRLKPHSAKPSKITIHYTGNPQNPNQSIVRKLRILSEFSKDKIEGAKQKLWGDVPYHYYIDMNGKSAEGRDPAYMPDTNTKYNPDGHITIVVEGTEGDDLSAKQQTKLFAMIKGLQNKYSIPTSKVGIHKHYASTSCPGEEIEAAIKEYKKQNSSFIPSINACNKAEGAVKPAPVAAKPAPVVAKPAPVATKPTTSDVRPQPSAPAKPSAPPQATPSQPRGNSGGLDEVTR